MKKLIKIVIEESEKGNVDTSIDCEGRTGVDVAKLIREFIISAPNLEVKHIIAHGVAEAIINDDVFNYLLGAILNEDTQEDADEDN